MGPGFQLVSFDPKTSISMVGIEAFDSDESLDAFTIATEYGGGRLPLTHVDLYRLERARDDELSLRDVLYGEGVAAVEWFDRLLPADPPGDPEEVLVIRLGLGPRAEPDRRHVRVEAYGPRHERWLERTFGA